MKPAPLDVRVARVIATPVPFLAYFLIRVPQVTVGAYVPWTEAVLITLLTVVMFPLWLYWCADLVSWRRDHTALTPDEFDATDGAFTGELPGIAQALPRGKDGRFAAIVPGDFARDDAVDAMRYATMTASNYFAQAAAAQAFAAESDAFLRSIGGVPAGDGETYHFGTGAHAAIEAALLTHEFTPASGIRAVTANGWTDVGYTDGGVIASWDPAADGQVCVARTEDGRVYPVDRVDVVPPGRHRAEEPRTHLPPIDEVENADAYSQLNRSRELFD